MNEENTGENMQPHNLKREANAPKVSSTKIFKTMLQQGWKVISKLKQKPNTFLVTLKKVFQEGKNFVTETKTFFVGIQALPKSLKVNKVPKHGSSRKGTPKPARMSYA
jgi:hypothetical protein